MTNLLNLTHTTHNQYCEQEIAQARTVASPGDVFLLLSNDLRRTDWQRAPLAQRYLGHVIAADWAGLVDSWRNRLPSEMGLGEVKFAADSPLEGRVTIELVSELKFRSSQKIRFSEVLG